MLSGCESNTIDDSSAIMEESATEVTTVEKTKITTESSMEQETETTEAIEDIGDVEIDNNPLTVVIDVPASLVNVTSEEESEQRVAENEGILDCVLHDNGSATITYDKDTYQEKLSELKENFEEQMGEICSQYMTLESVECDEDMKNITVYVSNANDYNNPLDCMGFLSIHMYCGSYQVLTGKYGEIETYYSLVDSTTDTEFKTNI